MIKDLSILKEREDIKAIITFPSCDNEVYGSRIRELELMDITAILSYGNINLGKIAILGKGCVGLAIPVIYRRKLCVLKVRRTDANRPDMYNEVFMHILANSVSVGPTLINYTRNFILMEFIEGKHIFDWFRSNTISKTAIRNIIASSLRQCFVLDRLGFDHGQLSRIKRHLIISSEGHPTIIDFESSSMVRRAANVTSLVQNFIASSFLFDSFGYSVTEKKRSEIMFSLREYKLNKTEESFSKILDFFYSIF